MPVFCGNAQQVLSDGQLNVSYVTDATPPPGRHVLTTIDYGATFKTPADSDAPHFNIANKQLNTPALLEMWSSDQPVTRGQLNGVTFSKTATHITGYLESPMPPGPTADTAKTMLQRVLTLLRELQFAHLMRIWNYVPDINDVSDGLEQYQQFCVGRHDAFFESGFETASAFPAATAVGGRNPALSIFFLATNLPITSVENPRQVSAFHYPAQYGPRSPSFARAVLAQGTPGNEQLYISGTASVVGHRSVHQEVGLQTEQTLLNMRALVEEAGRQSPSSPRWRDVRALKVYLREAGDLERVRPIVASALPGAPMIVLEADICRRELKVEIEGVWSRAA